MMNLTHIDASILSEDAHPKSEFASSGAPSPELGSSEGHLSPVLPSVLNRQFGDATSDAAASSSSPVPARAAVLPFKPPKTAHRIGSYIVGPADEHVGRRRAVSAINPNAGRLDCFVANARDAQHQIGLRIHLDEPTWLPNIVDTLVVGGWAYFFCVPTYGSLLDEFSSECVRGMDEGRVANLFGQMVDIVDFCHERGVILKDLTLRCFAFEDEAR